MSVSLVSQTAAESVASKAADFANLFAAEERHFWFRSRRRAIGQVFRRLTRNLPPGYRVLEVGCGTGNVLCELERVCAHGEVTGLDLHEEALRFARRRTRCRLLQADIHDLKHDKPFHLIGMFDVLEHLADDGKVLERLHAALVPGGRLVLTVPAHMTLWSHRDRAAEHYRRYSPKQLKQVLEENGFRVDYLSQFMMALFPLMWIGRRLAALTRKRALKPSEQDRDLALRELRIVPVVNTLISWSLAWERPLLRRGLRIPLGTSLLAVATATGRGQAAAGMALDAEHTMM